ncbi:MAG: ribosome-associated translation inhibitor RaiA [Planctomycetota bacterium]
MHVLITTRHIEASPEQKAYAEQKANKLLTFYDRIQEIEVVIEEAQPVGFHIEMLVNAEHNNNFVANSRSDKIEKCVDECYQKLERQLTEHKERHRNRKHTGAGESIRHQPV